MGTLNTYGRIYAGQRLRCTRDWQGMWSWTLHRCDDGVLVAHNRQQMTLEQAVTEGKQAAALAAKEHDSVGAKK